MTVRRDPAGAAVLRRVQNWLAAAVQADDLLEPKERVAMGNILARLGDSRFNANLFYLPNDEELGFVKIPAGEFLMGSDKARDSEAHDNEFPRHGVKLSEYWIARYPVTVVQYRVFVKETRYVVAEEWEEVNKVDNHPVVYVSWKDAVAYCEWLTQRLKDQGWLIRLPTEAEWERAARGDDGRIYPWGDNPDPDKANYFDTGIGGTSPVGCFHGGKSPFGILDMSGNVDEWCQDWYGGYPSARVVDPTGPSAGSIRVLRGGSRIFDAGSCRSAYRGVYGPVIRLAALGFRLVRSAR